MPATARFVGLGLCHCAIRGRRFPAAISASAGIGFATIARPGRPSAARIACARSDGRGIVHAQGRGQAAVTAPKAGKAFWPTGDDRTGPRVFQKLQRPWARSRIALGPRGHHRHRRPGQFLQVGRKCRNSPPRTLCTPPIPLGGRRPTVPPAPRHRLVVSATVVASRCPPWPRSDRQIRPGLAWSSRPWPAASASSASIPAADAGDLARPSRRWSRAWRPRRATSGLDPARSLEVLRKGHAMGDDRRFQRHDRRAGLQRTGELGRPPPPRPPPPQTQGQGRERSMRSLRKHRRRRPSSPRAAQRPPRPSAPRQFRGDMRRHECVARPGDPAAPARGGRHRGQPPRPARGIDGHLGPRRHQHPRARPPPSAPAPRRRHWRGRVPVRSPASSRFT